MTANEIINLALRQILEPIVKEHIQEVKSRDKQKRDMSTQRERQINRAWAS